MSLMQSKAVFPPFFRFFPLPLAEEKQPFPRSERAFNYESSPFYSILSHPFIFSLQKKLKKTGKKICTSQKEGLLLHPRSTITSRTQAKEFIERLIIKQDVVQGFCPFFFPVTKRRRAG